MPQVVFMRGVNVGGHRTFQPSSLAKELADFDVVNVGAAGTFVVRGKIGQAALRAEFLRRLQFAPEMMICPSRELINLARGEPFPDDAASRDARRYVTVLAKRPSKLPQLPLTKPEGEKWQVKVIAVSGRFVLSLHRKQSGTLIYPNEVVEKQFDVAATTRNWNTINSICEILTNER
jgi:uncharacterized protein (DUF1697 family)